MTTAVPTPVDGIDDAALARAAADGDRSAFGSIYDRYADRLHDFCIGMLRDRDAAADCVQDVFVTAATRLPQLREPDRLRSWLYAIARNEALGRIRHRRREQPSEQLPEMASGEPDLATLAARTELAGLISQACRGLSDRDQVVHELAYRQGLNGPELADALGVTHRNANTLVERVRVTMERSLGALLVCRRVKADPARCPDMAALTDHWDGQFTVLMRKRTARHIDNCTVCESDQARMVNPVALLGSAPVFLPAPAWLREQILTQVGPVFPPSGATPATTGGGHSDPGISAPNDPSAAAASHTPADPSWWPPRDLDTTDLGDPAPAPHTGRAPHPPTSGRHGGVATESAELKPSAAYTASGTATKEPLEPTERVSGYLRRHIRAVAGIGLLSVGVGVAVLLVTPEIFQVDLINLPGSGPTVPLATTTATTSPPLTFTPGPGGGGPTVPTTATSPPLTFTPGPGGGGPTVPTTATSPPLTFTPGPGGGGPTVPTTATSPPLTFTPGPGGGGPTVPTTATSPPMTFTPGPGGGGPTVPTDTTPIPTSNPPKKPLGPTGLNPPARQDPSDGSCPPTGCETKAPFQ